ncbi:unnamed protein product, partial [Rotaria sordida]
RTLPTVPRITRVPQESPPKLFTTPISTIPTIRQHLNKTTKPMIDQNLAQSLKNNMNIVDDKKNDGRHHYQSQSEYRFVYLESSFSGVSVLSVQYTDTDTSLASTTITTTTASTTDATMFIPSNYWTSCSASCTNVTTTTPSTLLASWKFENNLLDSANSYNGSMSSVPSYISGYVDQALIVNSVQYVTVSSYLSFFSRSFTIEAWIYVTSLISSVDYGIFGQYQAATT